MAMSDTIHIILASYNGEAHIKEQIESILKSTFQDWILEIHDDGSQDGTLDIANQFRSLYPEKIQIFQNKENKGFVKNFLEGARNALDDYFMFCDQDDVWLPEKIEHAFLRMKQMEKKWGRNLPMVVFSDAKVVDGNLNERHPSFHQSGRLDARKTDLPHLLMENKMMGCTMLCNKELKEKLSVLPEAARYHDWWAALIGAAFGKISYVPTADMLYRQHGKNIVGNQSFFSYAANRMKTLRQQRKVLMDTQKQAEEFYAIFHSVLSRENSKIVYEFFTLNQKNWFVRRKNIIKFKFYKTGIARNIGVMLMI